MHVLLVSEWGPCRHGGVASQVSLLENWLKQRGYQVSVLCNHGCCKGSGHVEASSLLPLDHYFAIPSPSFIEETVRRLKPDVIHVHHVFTPLSLATGAICKRLEVPCIFTNHSLPPVGSHDKWAPISYVSPYRWILKPTIATAVSNVAAEFAKRFLGWRNVKVIPNAVDCEKYRPGDGKRKNTVLYVGRLVWRKGVHVLVDASRRLSEMSRDTKIIIAGDGYMKPYLQAIAPNDERVLFLGEVDEQRKIKLYQESKVFVLPSLGGESFGVVLLESFASGTPVVASRVGGIPEIVDHGVNGLLTRPGDTRGLVSAIKLLLDDEELWSRLSYNARKKAEEKYSIRNIGRMYEETYIEALEKNSAQN